MAHPRNTHLKPKKTFQGTAAIEKLLKPSIPPLQPRRGHGGTVR
jgi:hypothetical protein